MSLLSLLVVLDVLIYVFVVGYANPPKAALAGNYVVIGYNDLGMHCLGQDFRELCILPPYNTLRATVIDRSGEDPRIVTGGIQVAYSIPGNTHSTGKTNFWNFTLPLFGIQLPPDIGLAGFGLAGNMQVTVAGDWIAQGIPATPLTDGYHEDAYQLAQVNVSQNGTLMALTQPVVPVSWEMRCDQCHQATRPVLGTVSPFGFKDTTNMRILKAHDKLSGSDLQHQVPVLCAKCHADPALGAPGLPGIPNLSSAMHTFHADKMGDRTDEQKCYSCHPGQRTQCLRDVHKANGMTCTDCHGSMGAVGDPARSPWQDEPRCGSCHSVQGHEYEQPGVLFRDSVGHNGVKCIVCHGSPHVIAPSLNARDNVQAIALQGYPGTLNKCTVCHSTQPGDPFNHTRGE